MRTTDHDEPQLSFRVDLHTDLIAEEEPWFFGSLKVKGDLRVGHDLQAGEELTVSIADADGQVIASAGLVVAYPGFKDIKEKGHVVGTERVHVAEVQT